MIGPITPSVTQKCRDCGEVFTSQQAKTWCPHCSSLNVQTVPNPIGYQTR